MGKPHHMWELLIPPSIWITLSAGQTQQSPFVHLGLSRVKSLDLGLKESEQTFESHGSGFHPTSPSLNRPPDRDNETIMLPASTGTCDKASRISSLVEIPQLQTRCVLRLSVKVLADRASSASQRRLL
jgi:hypothetical protein